MRNWFVLLSLSFLGCGESNFIPNGTWVNPDFDSIVDQTPVDVTDITIIAIKEFKINQKECTYIYNQSKPPELNELEYIISFEEEVMVSISFNSNEAVDFQYIPKSEVKRIFSNTLSEEITLDPVTKYCSGVNECFYFISENVIIANYKGRKDKLIKK